MKYILRDYQKEAVEAALNFFLGNSKRNAIEVLPTGSGKSLIIANIAKELDSPVLIFQPTKEILEQNFAKFISYGNDATIYSASVGQKKISSVTFATIGSVIRKIDILKDFKYVIVDECHFVNSKKGMYYKLFNQLKGVKILGVTATPYRLVTDGFGGSILKFLTRTRPRVFTELIYYVQNKELFEKGYLAELKYCATKDFSKKQLKLNTTGADYTDMSVKKYYNKIGFEKKILDMVNKVKEDRKNILVFTRFIAESEYLVERIPNSAIVTSKTPKKEREQIINGFKSGDIQIVCNVGILTTGFDYPELETIIIARPTMSLALFYQMQGRGIRPHPGKEHVLVIDMCDNLNMFGNIEDLKIVDGGNGKWFISSKDKQLTNVYYGDGGERKSFYKPNKWDVGYERIQPFRI